MMTGNVNTSVLPEPVKAMPIMSRPDKLLGKNRSEGQAQQNTASPSGHLVTVFPCCHPPLGPQFHTHMVGMPWI